MRLPRMTIKRWMVVVALAAVDSALIVQKASHPLSTVAFFGTCALIVLSPAMLLLVMLASDE